MKKLDLDELEQNLKLKGRPDLLDQDTLEGAIARLQEEGQKNFMRWKAKEINRETDPNDILRATILHCGSLLGMEVVHRNGAIKDLIKITGSVFDIAVTILNASPADREKFMVMQEAKEPH